MRLPNQTTLMVFAGAAAVLALAWMGKKTYDTIATPGAALNLGQAVGGSAVDLTMGVIGGVNDGLGIPRTSDVIDWANSSSNPLQPAGAWIGGKLYDLTHW